MHHLYPLAKGDALCPLGFHPQVRWPTRCKRCFRDYKEHGGRKKDDDFTASTPALSSWASPASRARDEENGAAKDKTGRSWSSSQNLSQSDLKEKKDNFSTGFSRTSASWTSSPDLNEVATAVTVSLKLPKRRLTSPLTLDTGQPAAPDPPAPTTVTLRRPSSSPPPVPAHLLITKNDSLAERVRKMQLIKAQNSFEKETSQERERQDRRSSSRSREEEKVTRSKEDDRSSRSRDDEKSSKDDVNFLIQVKHARNATNSKPPVRGGPSKDKDGYLSDDDISTAGTTTTETTLVDENVKEYQEQVEALKQEVDILRKRCERVEKEKSDILLRRLANLDTNKTGRSSEVLKLQQKVNDLTTQNEDLKDEKKSLSLRVKEMEAELESRPSMEAQTRQVEQVRQKLLAAETLCEELMDENEDMKKELRDLEEEIEEMQDNFREDQADEYSSLRRELEQSIKNCRVLSFKLKKSERKCDQLEQEKAEQEKKLLELAGGQSGLDRMARIKELETELSRSNEVALRLQRELQDATSKLQQQPATNQRRNPPLAVIGKTSSGEGQKVSRASLTRGGSQEDPQQLLRDLQDSLEREADLREQLKNAEEEANNLRKTASRVEEDNESLLLQLKKMATKARTRKLSPTPPTNRLSIENSIEKDEGISDEEDPAELRLLLELNEQEAAVLRRKVEELEHEGDSLKRQVKELTEKISTAGTKPGTTTIGTIKKKAGNLAEEKVKVLEDEIAELRKKLIEKERNCERLHAELSLMQKKPKAALNKSKSLDGVSEQQTVDLKRQLQVIEQEASILRNKTQTLESDNEKLQAENKKLQLLRGAKTLKSEKSLEQSTEKITQLETELKDALTKIKDLETKDKEEKPEKRVSFGGVVTKKDVDALKVKQEEVDKIKLNFNKVEKEKIKLETILKELKDNAIKSFKPRTPKKLTDLTTKLQMKKMVEELENEIGEMYVVMKNAEINKSPVMNSEKDIEEIRSKLSSTESELTNEKNRMQTEISKLKDLNDKLEKDKSALSEKSKKIEEEKKNALDEAKTLREEKKKLEVQMNKLNTDLKNSNTKQSAMADCMKKIEDLKKEMDVKDKEVEALKKQLEVKEKLEQDKSKLLKETGDKAKKITELEKKLKESEDKFKRTEKQLVVRKDRVAKLEKELSEEKEQVEAVTDSNRRMSMDFITEKDEIQTKLFKAEMKAISFENDLKDIIAENATRILTLESHLAAKESHIKQLEEALRETSNQKYDEAISSVEMAQIQEKLNNANRDLEVKEKELSAIKDEMAQYTKTHSQLQSEFNSMKSNMDKLSNDKKESDNNVKVQKKEADYWESKASEFETDLQAERKKVDRMRIAHEKDSKNKEAELATLKGKLRTLEQTSGAGTKKITELKQEFEENIKKLEHSLAVERAEYEELTGKYELLEEEHVVTKAKLTIEKEAAQGDLLQAQKELNSVSGSLKSLQETHNNQIDMWLKERSVMQDQISKLQERLCGGGWEVEKARLQAKLDQREKEYKLLAEQHDVTIHQQEALKREVDDARTKLDDYEKVHKVQRNQAAQNAEMERELKLLQKRLDQADKLKKTEVSECKMRYDSQMQSMQNEHQSLQNQVSRFRRERDTYKQMLEQAHKNMQELKSGDSRSKRSSISSVDEEEHRSKLLGLEQQVACLEDELCEARLGASKLKTELVSEKSTAEIKLSEMQSKLNEYEEERLLSSGRSRVAGMATRMELAWQKERDEQQRLLQETSTLARDLRQTLFEVERERDKERLDMKRRIDQLKRTTEEETDENKKKVTELQCDLLELRDAHAKLRTTNEKLRRDKERHDREREQNKLLVASLKRAQQEDDRKTSFLLESIEDLMKQAPDVFKTTTPKPEAKTLLTPTPPRRNRSSKSRSREATPESAGEDGAGVAATLAKLQRATDELKASRVVERQRRQANMRRAASTEPRDTMIATVTPRPSNGRTPSLKKRSISLEQTTKDQSAIWKTVEDGSVSSIQSLDGDMDGRLFSMQRDTSLDSRLSGGSTQSDVLPAGEKKKKKGLFGKLKQLTKSRSIDDQAGPDVAEFRPIGTVSQGSDSDMSAAGSKKDIRGRLSDMFHRKGQLSRGSSKDGSRELSTPLPERSSTSSVNAAPNASSLRPLSRNSSSSNIPRAEAQRSDASVSSRAASATPAAKRKGK